MCNIRVILWDIDGTLLNFYEAQKNAIRACFKEYNLGICTDDMLNDYDKINHRYWNRLENGEITKTQVLTGRFYEFFEKYNLNTAVVDEFNNEYQVKLGDTICFFKNAFETVNACKKAGIRQYAVTNGTKTAQIKKLTKSGLIDIFDAVFISDDLGYEKPSVEFFEPVLKRAYEDCDNLTKSEIMIVGDSMTSDMQGGINAGIITCFYARPGQIINEKLSVDYEIDDLIEVAKMIKIC